VLLPPVVAVAKGCLIPMMAVGDDEAGSRQIFPDSIEQGRFGGRPESYGVAVLIGDHGCGRTRARPGRPGAGDAIPRKVIEQKDRAKTHRRRVHQCETVLLGTGEGLLVRIDDSLGKRVEAHGC